MKKITFLTLILIATQFASGQNLLNKVKNVGNNVLGNKQENSSNNTSSNTNTQSSNDSTSDYNYSNNSSSKKSSPKSDFHKKHVGKIVFANKKIDENFSDESAIVNEFDLSKPIYYNVYLDKTLSDYIAEQKGVNMNSYFAAGVTINYYINDELIATYYDDYYKTGYEGGDLFKTRTILPEVLLPANDYDFSENKFKVAVFTHVFSILNDGKYDLKLEFLVPDYENSKLDENNSDLKHKVVATGSAKINIKKDERDRYCRTYGRPKFTKGVASDPKVEKEFIEVIKRYNSNELIYVFADDNWVLKRNQWGDVISREAYVNFIYKNKTGRCEMDQLKISQSYDGKQYYNAIALNYLKSTFKYVACQNY